MLFLDLLPPSLAGFYFRIWRYSTLEFEKIERTELMF